MGSTLEIHTEPSRPTEMSVAPASEAIIVNPPLVESSCQTDPSEVTTQSSSVVDTERATGVDDPKSETSIIYHSMFVVS